MKRSVKLTLVLLALLILAITSSAYVHHFRPLISSTNWTASMKVEGHDPITGEVFYLLGRPGTLFIRFPEAIPNDTPGCSWFSAETSSKFVGLPGWPRTTPYLHFNHDKSIGVDITDGKIDDGWQSEWTDTGFSFWNQRRTITIMPANK